MEGKLLVFMSTLLIPLLLWCAAAAQTPLYFSLILSFGRYGFNSSVMIPAMEIALERIRETQILPGYRLEYSSVRDSEVRCTAKTNWFKWYIQQTVCKRFQAEVIDPFQPVYTMIVDQSICQSEQKFMRGLVAWYLLL